MTERFLPDLGTRIQSQSGDAPVRVAGMLSVQVIDRYLDEYTSFSGTCSIGGKDYCGTFDLGGDSWPQASRLLQENFYLDLSRFAPDRHSALKCDPPLDMAMDLEVRPKVSVQSQKTDESFVPLEVTHVRDLGLATTTESLEKRHEWWVQQSRTWCGVTEPSVAKAWSALVKPSRMAVRGLDYAEVIKNVAGCCLACRGSERVSQTIEMLVRHGLVESLDKSHRPSVITSLNSKPVIDIRTLRQALANLALWYAGGRILAHSEQGSIERALAGILNSDGSDSVEVLLTESRYCLSRRERPSLRDDEIEKQLQHLAQEHAGIRTILESRMAKFPETVWDHPEVSVVTKSYVTYDLLRQIYQARGDGLVSRECAERCEQNVQMIGQWLRQCASVEIAPFGEGLQSMRTP